MEQTGASERHGATLAAATDEFSDSEANEYGLKDLAILPLLEQVHRLYHAIQQQYPYKETNAWKMLPIEQKRRMLEYIRERRAKKEDAPPPQPSTPTLEAKPEPKPVVKAPPTTAKSDPYLQMLQKRTLNTAPVASSLAHPSSAYIAGQPQPAQYVENRSFTSRWKVMDAEFYEDPVCACGKKHSDTAGSSTAAFDTTLRAMLSTFGDHDRPCLTTVKRVKAIIGEYLRERLSPLEEDGQVHAPCLRTLVEIFSEEAVYYGRWREFRGETKPQETDLETVEEDELADELDLFAVSEADLVFNEAFLERIRFADERTRGMDWSIYSSFAKSRKLNFMSQRGAPLRDWLGLGSCSRASLEFMNFVAYHNIGRLIEAAIRVRTGGRLQALDSALLKTDIDAATEAFTSSPQYQPSAHAANALDVEEPPAKLQRTGLDRHDVVVTATTTSESSSTSGSSSSSSSSSSTTAETPAVPQRLTRLKRLR